MFTSAVRSFLSSAHGRLLDDFVFYIGDFFHGVDLLAILIDCIAMILWMWWFVDLANALQRVGSIEAKSRIQSKRSTLVLFFFFFRVWLCTICVHCAIMCGMLIFIVAYAIRYEAKMLFWLIPPPPHPLISITFYDFHYSCKRFNEYHYY